MTTAIDHTPSRACRLRGCESEACKRAAYLYMKQLYIDHTRGHRRTQDATETRTHLGLLFAANWEVHDIAQATGLSASTIKGIRAGQAAVTNKTARAILGIPIGPPPQSPVDATGTIRRIRALAYIGHSLERIALHADMSSAKVGRIAAGRFATVTPDTAQAVARAYRTLSTIPGTSLVTRNRARRDEWHGPLAWDDIDNPDCKPETGRRLSAARASTRPKVHADPAVVAQLTAAGKSAAQIALQLGCHQRTVVRARGRATTEAVAA